MELKFRPYQQKGIDRILSSIENSKKQHISASLATGTGKIAVANSVVSALISRGARVLVLAERKQICAQAYHSFIKDEPFESTAAMAEPSHELVRIIEDKGYSAVYATIQNVIGKELFEAVDSQFDFIVLVDVNFARSNKTGNALVKGVQRARLISISSSPEMSEFEHFLFGEHVYYYGVSDAIQDGYLASPVFTAKPNLSRRALYNPEFLRIFCEELLRLLEPKSRNKILVVCWNTDQAKQLKEVLVSFDSELNTILLTSSENDVNQNIQQFKSAGTPQIGISVNLQVGLDISDLSDLVILRRFSSRLDFAKTLSLAMRLQESRKRVKVWDFGGNANLIAEEEVEFVDETDDTSFQFDDGFDLEAVRYFEHDALKEKILEPDEASYGPPKNDDDTPSVKSHKRFLANPSDDKPSSVDLLGREGLVSILKGIVDRDSRKHLIVALFGRWGSGKSTVIELLHKRYEEVEGTRFLVFNAWQNGHSQNMTASIAEAIVDNVYSGRSPLEQMWLSLKGQYESNRHRVYFTSIFFLLVFIALASYFFGGAIYKSGWSAAVGFLGTALLTAIPTSLWAYYKNPFTSKLEKLSQRPNFGSHIGISDSIRQQLECLLKVEAKNKNWFSSGNKKSNGGLGKYILVVDDLDRCSDQKILETLEAVQLVVNLEGLVVVLAIDDQVLIHAIACHYQAQRKGMDSGTAFAIAREFLGKILQITISLDKPNFLNREQFVKGRLYPAISDKEHVGIEQEKLPENEAPLSKPLDESKSVEELLDFGEYVLEEDDSYDETEEYLSSERYEYEFFKRCMRSFNVHNPRTLIRLHNVITIAKGLHPAITDDKNMLSVYMYLAFWFEYYLLMDKEKQENMYEVLYDKAKKSSDDIAQLGYDIELPELHHEAIKKALYRIKNLSLPTRE